MSKSKKSVNPAEYGRWHEITEADTENCNPSKRGNRLSLVSIHQLEAEKIKMMKDETQPENHLEVPKSPENITFKDDESLKGLDTIIKRLKEKAINNHVNESHNSEEKDKKSKISNYNLDDIGKSVLEGLTDAEFLDQLEKELESEADKLHNIKE